MRILMLDAFWRGASFLFTGSCAEIIYSTTRHCLWHQTFLCAKFLHRGTHEMGSTVFGSTFILVLSRWYFQFQIYIYIYSYVCIIDVFLVWKQHRCYNSTNTDNFNLNQESEFSFTSCFCALLFLWTSVDTIQSPIYKQPIVYKWVSWFGPKGCL